MSEYGSRPTMLRARPLAELGFDGLLERAGELSRGWVVALILERPPERIGEVALEDLAREAPGLVAALLKALRSDDELVLVQGEGSPAARLPSMAGAVAPAAVVGAIEALRGVIWDALIEEFGYLASDPTRARRLTDLADRLAGVCAALLAAALTGEVPDQASPGTAGPEPGDTTSAEASAPHGPAAAPPRQRGRGLPSAVIVDEHIGFGPAESSWDTSPPLQSVSPLPSPAAEIQIRDERGDEGPAAWIRSIGRQLESYERDGAAFAVLLVELRGDGAGAWERIEELLTAEVRGAAGGSVTRERAGRYWLLAPATDRIAAGSVAARITGTLEEFIRARRIGLDLAVGTAVCPEDGRRASALAAHADVGLFAARSEHAQPPPRLAPAPEG